MQTWLQYKHIHIQVPESWPSMSLLLHVPYTAETLVFASDQSTMAL